MAITRMTNSLQGAAQMLSRRSVVWGSIAVLATGGHGFAAEQSAQDFLASIYAAYKGKGAKGIKLATIKRGAPARYFTPGLARLIQADERAAARDGEIPTLGADPFIDAQDFEINAFAIDVKDTAAGKAVGTVKFKNLGENVSVTLDLVKGKNGWRIDDIHWPKWSLRALLEKSAPFKKK
jgi:hypothetical protein